MAQRELRRRRRDESRRQRRSTERGRDVEATQRERARDAWPDGIPDRAKVKSRMASDKIRIKLKAYDHKLLDASTAEIVETAVRTGARVAGPMPLPTKISRWTVLRGPFIDKKSREQFEMRTHKRLLDILEPTQQTIDELGKLELSSGIDVELKLQ